MSEPEAYLVLKQLTDAFDDLKISYALGGSIASSVYGKVRFTQDADITVAPFDDKAGQLDMKHLRSCPEKLGVKALLEKALSESQEFDN